MELCCSGLCDKLKLCHQLSLSKEEWTEQRQEDAYEPMAITTSMQS